MKRAHRDRALNRLFADLQSGDFDVREYALFQLVQLLRRARAGAADAGDYADGEPLPRYLQRLRLSPADQARIAAQLAQVIARHADSRASALWALGEVAVESGFAKVVAAIQAHGDQFSDEAAFQACRALRHWLESDGGDARALARLLEDGRLLSRLGRWSRSPDARLAKSAKGLINAIERSG